MRPRQAADGAGHDRAALGVDQNAAEQFRQMIVQAARDFTLVNHVCCPRSSENVGVPPLMIVGGMRIGQEHRGRRSGRELSQRRSARAA